MTAADTAVYDDLSRLMDVPVVKPKASESLFHKIGVLICPNCKYCEFPGCREHSSMLSFAKGNGHAACSQCVKGSESSYYSCSTDTSSPWCNACRNCDETRADVSMWVMSDPAVFAMALAVYNASDKSEFDTDSSFELMGLVCEACATAEVQSLDGALLTKASYEAALARGHVFSLAQHYAPNCTGALYAEPILLSKGEAVYCGSSVGTTPRLPLNHTLESRFKRPKHWQTHPAVDSDPALAALAMRSVVPDTRYALASMRVHPHPFPVWQARGFVGQFGDPFVKNTELEGGSVLDSLVFFEHYLAQLPDRIAPLQTVSAGTRAAVARVSATLRQAHEAAKEFNLVTAMPAEDPSGVSFKNGVLAASSTNADGDDDAAEDGTKPSTTTTTMTDKDKAAAPSAAARDSDDADGAWTDSDDEDDFKSSAESAAPVDIATLPLESIWDMVSTAIGRRRARAAISGAEPDEDDVAIDDGARALLGRQKGEDSAAAGSDQAAADFNRKRALGGSAGAAAAAPTIKETALAALAYQHTQKILALQPGEVYAFPGGYRKPHGGHAIMQIVVRGGGAANNDAIVAAAAAAGAEGAKVGLDMGQLNGDITRNGSGEDEYDFVICNSGNGLDNHPGMAHGTKTRQVTTMCVPRIPRGRMASELFWTLYLRAMTYPSDDHQVPFFALFKDKNMTISPNFPKTCLCFNFANSIYFVSYCIPLAFSRSRCCTM